MSAPEDPTAAAVAVAVAAVATLRSQIAEVSGKAASEDEPVEIRWLHETNWEEIRASQVNAAGPVLRFETEHGVRLCAPGVVGFSLRPKMRLKAVD